MLVSTHPRRLAALLAPVCFAACSTLPPSQYPEFVDHHVAAEYVVSPEGRLWLPSTTRSLVVRELDLHPRPVRERFDDTGRWFEYPAGTAVRVECRLRAYAADDGHVPSLREILGDATKLEDLGSP